MEKVTHAIVIRGDIASYHSNLGVILQALGRLDEAVASYGRAVALNPDLAEAHNNVGTILELLVAQSSLVDAKASQVTARYRTAPAQAIVTRAARPRPRNAGAVSRPAAAAPSDRRAQKHTLTASLTAPTGNRTDGLSTGRVTFDFRDIKPVATPVGPTPAPSGEYPRMSCR